MRLLSRRLQGNLREMIPEKSPEQEPHLDLTFHLGLGWDKPAQVRWRNMDF